MLVVFWSYLTINMIKKKSKKEATFAENSDLYTKEED